MQKHQQWWKQSCARGQVGHGQEFVETTKRARISAFDLKEHDMDLATMFSLLTSASATSHVDNYQIYLELKCVYSHKVSHVSFYE